MALCRFGVLDTKAISQITIIPRQDIYRVTEDLTREGLIEQVISKPTAFRAIPIEKGVSVLLSRKQKELSRIESKSKILIENFRLNNTKPVNNKPQFVLIPGKEALIERLSNLVEKAQETIDSVSSHKRFSRVHIFSEALESAWSRGVKCRFVMEKPEKGRAAEEVLKFLTKSCCCEVRFIPYAPETVMAIYDQKEILIIVNPKAEIWDSAALWSNNSSLIAGMRDYFNILWITALEEPEYRINGEQL